MPSLSVAFAVRLKLAGAVKLALLAGAVMETVGATLGALTVIVLADEVLAASSASPAYTAVMLCAPVVLKLVVKLALAVLPAPLNVPAPKVAAPSLKVTVPVGVKPATVAVTMTL